MTSSSTPNSSVEYPFPTEFNVRDFVPDFLSEDNHSEWKKLMWDFIEKRGLLGFINGDIKVPNKLHLVSNEPVQTEDYKSWKKTNDLVRGWILTTLPREFRLHFLFTEIAREVWTNLESRFVLTKVSVENREGQQKRAQRLLKPATSGVRVRDFALHLVDRKPELAKSKKASLLSVIAEKKSSFQSGISFNFWQKWLYSRVPIKLERIANLNGRGGDVENPGGDVKNPEAGYCIFSLDDIMKQKWNAMFWDITEIFVLQMKNIREKKLIHHKALKLVQFLCEEVEKLSSKDMEKIFSPILFKATSIGINEIVEEILLACPTLIYVRNVKNQTIFQCAIEWRQERVFNLLYQIGFTWQLLSFSDLSFNNALHLAGCLGPKQQLTLRAIAPGAALQMQRELQWFKEVEKFSRREDSNMTNANNMRPADVFTESHKELVKEGERWMKDTSTSCTIVAALIATVLFAGAITVPGGNNNNGYPYFSKQKSFIVFGIFDALGLFSSITSVLMFMFILTSRYAEYDFLYALPNRLIIGLLTLFVSMLSTMVAFGATLYLVFGHNKAWVLIPIVILASLPVTSFIALQFPLLVEIIKSTYGPGIFGKQSNSWLC